MFVKKPTSLILVAAFVCAVPAAADDIALSLVHGQDRIDIPVRAIVSIEALATQTFTITDTQETADLRYAERRALLQLRDPTAGLPTHPADHRTTAQHRRRLRGHLQSGGGRAVMRQVFSDFSQRYPGGERPGAADEERLEPPLRAGFVRSKKQGRG